jgi:hypothetical protein
MNGASSQEASLKLNGALSGTTVFNNEERQQKIVELEKDIKWTKWYISVGFENIGNLAKEIHKWAVERQKVREGRLTTVEQSLLRFQGLKGSLSDTMVVYSHGGSESTQKKVNKLQHGRDDIKKLADLFSYADQKKPQTMDGYSFTTGPIQEDSVTAAPLIGDTHYFQTLSCWLASLKRYRLRYKQKAGEHIMRISMLNEKIGVLRHNEEALKQLTARLDDLRK